MQEKRVTRIMYAAPRLHTNMVPIIRGWKQKGCSVAFLAQYEAANEVHDYVYYHQIKDSLLSSFERKVLNRKYDAAEATHKMIYAFIPSIVDIIREIKKCSPDVVIMRERNLTTALITLACGICGIKRKIVYIQRPLLMETSQNRIKKIIRRMVFPKVTYSPVLFRGVRNCQKTELRPHEWFVPLITVAGQKKGKEYCVGNKLHILDIGKYQDYKNHFFLIDALKPFCHDEDIEVTIVGQGSSPGEMDYKKRLMTYISQNNLDSIVRVIDNIKYEEMSSLYEENDVLILASKGEGAGMVILEAMGYGLCVLSSIYCGLTSYVTNAGCGIAFDLQSPEEVTNAIMKLKENKSLVAKYGELALDTVLSNYTFDNYFEALNRLCEIEFEYRIVVGN